MVHHVRDLAYVTGYQEPSTYVKVYLLPDPTKATKRKTKIVKRNCHPSFMEMVIIYIYAPILTIHLFFFYHAKIKIKKNNVYFYSWNTV